jgi:hypothetical protein
VTTPTETEQKIKAVTVALGAGEMYVRLDARQPGVSVPVGMAKDAALILKFSHRYDPGDVVINEWGIAETLSFGGIRYKVRVPWGAIYEAASNPLNTFWRWSIPAAPENLEHAPKMRGLRLVN